MAGSKRVEESSAFASRLLQLLEKRDMKQADLARALHMDRATITRYAKGRVPPVPVLNSLAKYFDVSVDYLLGNTDESQGSTNPRTAATPPNDHLDRALDQLQHEERLTNAEREALKEHMLSGLRLIRAGKKK